LRRGTTNYSRSYGYYIEPIIHTGVLASYEFTEWLSINGGLANGVSDRTVLNKINDRAYDSDESVAAGKLSYVGSVALTAPEHGLPRRLHALWRYREHRIAEDANGETTSSLYAGVAVYAVEALSVGAAMTTSPTGSSTILTQTPSRACALQLSEKLKLTGVGLRHRQPSTFGTATGNDVELFGDGYVGLLVWANAITRLEFRWDNDCPGMACSLTARRPVRCRPL
jgi:hypothetical protein